MPTEIKAAFIKRLVGAGLTIVEATSMVRPEWVPQLPDAGELYGSLAGDIQAGVRFPVLVPNSRGLERAMSLGVRDIAVFASATESSSLRNLNRGRTQTLELLAPVVARAKAAGLPVRAYLSMCFGDPWEGDVPIGQGGRRGC